MENLTKTEVILIVIAVYLFFRLIKELAYIKLYSFIIKLKAEGKLIPENDPNNVEGQAYNNLQKHKTKYF